MPIASQSGIIARGTHGLSDADGILAFAMHRRGADDIQIAEALGHDPFRVRAFFWEYRRRAWPRALIVPKYWSPETIADIVAELMATGAEGA